MFMCRSGSQVLSQLDNYSYTTMSTYLDSDRNKHMPFPTPLI